MLQCLLFSQPILWGLVKSCVPPSLATLGLRCVWLFIRVSVLEYMAGPCKDHCNIPYVTKAWTQAYVFAAVWVSYILPFGMGFGTKEVYVLRSEWSAGFKQDPSLLPRYILEYSRIWKKFNKCDNLHSLVSATGYFTRNDFQLTF